MTSTTPAALRRCASTRPQQTSDRLWNVHDVASYLHVHEKSIYRLVARRELPCIYIGNRLRFRPDDIDRWVSARKED